MSDWLTLRSYPGEVATLRPALTSPSYPLRINSLAVRLRVQGLKLTSGGTSAPASGGLIDNYGSFIEVLDNEITASADNGVYTDEGSDHMTMRGNNVHDNGTVIDGNQDHGVYLQGDDHLVESNTFANHPQGFGVQMYDNGLRNRVLSNIISNSGNGRPCCGGLVVGGGSSGTYANVEIAFNTITNSQGFAIDNDRLDGACGPWPGGSSIHDNSLGGDGIDSFPAGCAFGNIP